MILSTNASVSGYDDNIHIIEPWELFATMSMEGSSKTLSVVPGRLKIRLIRPKKMPRRVRKKYRKEQIKFQMEPRKLQKVISKVVPN